jgi:hypothetical protein
MPPNALIRSVRFGPDLTRVTGEKFHQLVWRALHTVSFAKRPGDKRSPVVTPRAPRSAQTLTNADRSTRIEMTTEIPRVRSVGGAKLSTRGIHGGYSDSSVHRRRRTPSNDAAKTETQCG